MKVLVFNCRKVLEINCRKLLVSTCFLHLSGEPYKVYKKLLKDRVTDKKTADKLAAIVLSLYSQENEDEPDSVRKWLKY